MTDSHDPRTPATPTPAAARDPRQASEPRSASEAPGQNESGAPADAARNAGQRARLERLERVVEQIRDAVVTQTREEEHRDFSLAWLIGSILQVLVGGLVVLALVDWLLGNSAQQLVIKLAFALVLQAMAHTAFALARPGRSP